VDVYSRSMQKWLPGRVMQSLPDGHVLVVYTDGASEWEKPVDPADRKSLCRRAQPPRRVGGAVNLRASQRVTVAQLQSASEAEAREGQAGYYSRESWLPDDAAAVCMSPSCASDKSGEPMKFSFVKRRHHCRRCGHIFCSDCSSGRVVIVDSGEDKAHRVCTACAASLAEILAAKEKGAEAATPRSEMTLHIAEPEDGRPFALDFAPGPIGLTFVTEDDVPGAAKCVERVLPGSQAAAHAPRLRPHTRLLAVAGHAVADKPFQACPAPGAPPLTAAQSAGLQRSAVAPNGSRIKPLT
jgi:hypothetical protein